MGDDDKALIQWLILHEIDAKTVAWYLFKTIPRANRPFQEPQNAVPVVERIVETMRAGGPDDDTMISRLDATARSLAGRLGFGSPKSTWMREIGECEEPGRRRDGLERYWHRSRLRSCLRQVRKWL
jgi:hypothetical protein